MLSRLKNWAFILRRDSHAIYLAARDPRVPWHVKILAIAVAGYALSPIDLIPDFIPVFGYLDDLIIVPAGIWLVAALIPREVLLECRAKASAAAQRPNSTIGIVIVVVLWVLSAAAAGWVVLRMWP